MAQEPVFRYGNLRLVLLVLAFVMFLIYTLAGFTVVTIKDAAGWLGLGFVFLTGSFFL